MDKQIEELRQWYQQQLQSGSFPHQDLRDLQQDFAEEFNRYASEEIISADFNTYMMFTYGLSSGGIVQKLNDPLERYKTREWLNKSFFEWFPKYRFLESYDLSEYHTLYQELIMIDKLRKKLLAWIDLKENS